MSIEAMKKAMAALESCAPEDTSSGYVIYQSFDEKLVDQACEALRTAIQQAEAQRPDSGAPVWFHKHWCDGDDIFYTPDDKIPPGATPLYTHPAPGVPDDVQQIIKEVCEVYRGTDYGKVAESICDKLIEVITAKAQEDL